MRLFPNDYIKIKIISFQYICLIIIDIIIFNLKKLHIGNK